MSDNSNQFVCDTLKDYELRKGSFTSFDDDALDYAMQHLGDRAFKYWVYLNRIPKGTKNFSIYTCDIEKHTGISRADRVTNQLVNKGFLEIDSNNPWKLYFHSWFPPGTEEERKKIIERNKVLWNKRSEIIQESKKKKSLDNPIVEEKKINSILEEKIKSSFGRSF